LGLARLQIYAYVNDLSGILSLLKSLKLLIETYILFLVTLNDLNLKTECLSNFYKRNVNPMYKIFTIYLASFEKTCFLRKRVRQLKLCEYRIKKICSLPDHVKIRIMMFQTAMHSKSFHRKASTRSKGNNTKCSPIRKYRFILHKCMLCICSLRKSNSLEIRMIF
jgi:hypothetical protein